MSSETEVWRTKSDEDLKENLKFIHTFGIPEAEAIKAEAMRRWGTMTPSEPSKPRYCDMCGQLSDKDATTCSACGNQKLTVIHDSHRPWITLTDFQLKKKLLFNTYTQDERTWLVFEAMRRGIIQSTHLPALFDFDLLGCTRRIAISDLEALMKRKQKLGRNPRRKKNLELGNNATGSANCNGSREASER
jgi:hypothetical protein